MEEEREREIDREKTIRGVLTEYAYDIFCSPYDVIVRGVSGIH